MRSLIVMAGLDPATQGHCAIGDAAFDALVNRSWVAGSSPAMTVWFVLGA
jgi:hypothetical protein